MKLRELKEKSTQEMEKLLRETRESLRGMRFGVSTGQETHVRSLRIARKTIAQILTIKRSRRERTA